MNINLLGNRYKGDDLVSSFLPINMVQERALYHFIKDCDEGKFAFEEYNCECGATKKDFEVLAKKDRYGIDVNTVICKKCGQLMTNPRMTQESYNLFYDIYYRDIYSGSATASDCFFENQLRHGKIIHSIVSRECDMNTIRSVLEIGCGAGGILQAFKSDSVNVKGVDLGSEYIKYGRNQGLDLENIASSVLVERGKKYDLIILSHVFEHFLDLEKELTDIYSLLSDNGKLYIEVPGVYNIRMAGGYNGDILMYLQNAHVRHFTKNLLVKVMAKYGFKNIYADEQVASIFCKGKEDITYENDYQRIINKWKSLEESFLDAVNGERDDLERDSNLYNIEQEYFSRWMNNLNRKKLTCQYLLAQGYDSAAIYGNGNIGQQLYLELTKTGYKVDYIVKTEEADINFSIPVVNVKDRFPNTKVIILTKPMESTRIRKLLKEYTFDIVPFGEIILEQQEEYLNENC